MKLWQRGIQFETLERHAAIFKARHKPLVFGAFGLVKERDIAAAIHEQRLAWAKDDNAPHSVGAAALVHRLRAGSTHRDYTGRELRIASGSVMVSAFACYSAEAGHRLLCSLKAKAGASTPLYVEAFEEDELAKEALHRAGMYYAMSKIAAGSEVKGMYAALPALLPHPLSFAERAALEICVPNFATGEEVAAALAEIEMVEAALRSSNTPMWAQHYSSYNKRQSWTAVALCGFDRADPSFIIAPREMSQQWKIEHPERLLAKCERTDAYDDFPEVTKLVERIPGEKERVRLMRLAPNDGELSRHADITDRLAGVADGRIARCHIPLRTHEAVRFRAWSDRGELIERHLPEGALCFLDQRKPHAVKNGSPNERIHIVADVVSSPELRELLFRENPS